MAGLIATRTHAPSADTLPLRSVRPSCCCTCSFIGLPGNLIFAESSVFFPPFSRNTTSLVKGDRCHSVECTWAYRCTQMLTVIHHIVPA